MELTEEVIFDNFRGKPFEAKLTVTEGKVLDCKFEQFDVTGPADGIQTAEISGHATYSRKVPDDRSNVYGYIPTSL